MKIPFCKPSWDEREVEAVSEVIRSGWWTDGPKVKEFETKFAEYVGAKHAVFLNSCTSALFLSLKWEQKKKGFIANTVYVPSLTFCATVNEIVNAGMIPVFGDVDRDTLCLEPNGEEYGMALPVHLIGNQAFTDYPYPVVEDSAHRIIKGQCFGSKNSVCFSFYATKNISTGGEGGMICTNDDDAYIWFQQARHHGISKGGWDRYKEGGSWRYDIEFVGWKANSPDMQGAIGLVQLDKLDSFNANRFRVIDTYNSEFGYFHKGLHLYPILVGDRDEFITFMKKNGIQCSVHFLPIHKMSAYKFDVDLPNTDYLGEHLVSLPLFPSMTNQEVEYVCQKVKESNQLLPWLG